MGVAAPQAPVGGWCLGLLKSLVTGPSLLVNCYLENQFHKKSNATLYYVSNACLYCAISYVTAL